MKLLSETTNNPSQRMNLVFENGETGIFILKYKTLQQAWFWDFIMESKNFSTYGNRLVLAPNILRRFKNIIDVGIQVISSDKVEPFNINDFVTDRVSILLLNSQEVQDIEAQIYGAG